MIRSFRHKGLETFYHSGDKRGILASHASKLSRILGALDVATLPSDLDLPGFKLHPLKGHLKGYWSVTVHANWRVIFQFDGVDVKLLDYLDYH